MPRPALSIHQDQHHSHPKTRTVHTPRPAPSICQDLHHPYAETGTIPTPRLAASRCRDQHRPYTKTSTIHTPRRAPSTPQDQHHPYTKTSTTHMPRPAPSLRQDQHHPYTKTGTNPMPRPARRGDSRPLPPCPISTEGRGLLSYSSTRTTAGSPGVATLRCPTSLPRRKLGQRYRGCGGTDTGPKPAPQHPRNGFAPPCRDFGSARHGTARPGAAPAAPTMLLSPVPAMQVAREDG